MGLSYLQADKLNQASKAFINAYKYNKTEKNVHKNIITCGKSQFEKGDFKSALETFTFCLNFKKSTEVYTYLGATYDKMNNNEKALEFFTKALKKSPKSKTCIDNLKYIENKIQKGNGFFARLFNK